MSHDVFISYDSADTAVMEGVCGWLEDRGLTCWIAPRDINEGESFPAQIVAAVKATKVLVLVLSQTSNVNRNVESELNVAIKAGIGVAPLLTEGIELSPNLEFFIGTCQWVDATSGELENSLPTLLETVERLKANTGQLPGAGSSSLRSAHRRFGKLGLLGGILVGILALAYYLATSEGLGSKSNSSSNQPLETSPNQVGLMSEPDPLVPAATRNLPGIEGVENDVSPDSSSFPWAEANNEDQDGEETVATTSSLNDHDSRSDGDTDPTVSGGLSGLEDQLMLLVTGGTYPVGCQSGDKNCFDDEPPRLARVEDFWIDKVEVTRDAFAACVLADRCPKADTGGDCVWDHEGSGTLPVNCVDWSAAAAYCKFHGMRLPSEDEWEVAARGLGHPDYPWGDLRPSCQHAAIGAIAGEDCGMSTPAPVGSFNKDRSWMGALDMGGNVREWVSDDYEVPASNKRTPQKINRGGSWQMKGDELFTSHTRGTDDFFAKRPDLGFRCASSSQPEE